MANQRSFLSAVKWAYTANWGERGFSALFTILLAAILGPRDFGIVTIAMIYITFIQMLLDQGFVVALIQRKDLRHEHLNAVFWMNLLLSLVLIGFSFFFSHWWASWNHLPALVPIIMALSICIPIKALSIIQAVNLKREMDFKSLSLRANASVLVSGVVGIGMALGGFGVWALVAQQIVREFAGLLLLWMLSPWRPRFDFSWKHFRELLGFSFSVFVSQLGMFADAQAGAILLGTLFGPVAVGLYRMAERLMSTVMVMATSSIQWVALPEFSRLQDNPEALRNSVLTCIRLSSIITLPAMAGLAVLSDSLMATMGAEWTPAADVLKVLAILGMLLMFSFFTGPLLQALSMPQFSAVLEWARTLIGIGLVVVAAYIVRDQNIQWEIMGIACARFVHGMFFVAPVFLYILLRICGISICSLVRAVAPAVVAAAVIVGSVCFFQYSGLLSNSIPLVILATQTVIGGVAGCTVLLFLDTRLRMSIISTVQKYVHIRAY